MNSCFFVKSYSIDSDGKLREARQLKRVGRVYVLCAADEVSRKDTRRKKVL